MLAAMWLIRLYARVLGQLGSDLKVGAWLALANVALAITAFAEPILFGRIIDVLTRAQVPGRGAGDLRLPDAADRSPGSASGSSPSAPASSSRCMRTGSRTAARLAVMANYFEHVLELPLAFHTSTHSGRVLKVMLEGSNGMAWLWLGFFREHLAALVALVVLLPLTLFLNWRLGLLLVLLVVRVRDPHRHRPAQDRDAAGLRRALSIRASPSMPPTRSATCR